jgi:hypothetical protein
MAPRGPNGGCAPVGPFLVGLRLDLATGHPVIAVESTTGEFPDGFPPVVWPFGFTASLDGNQGRVVAPDGSDFLTGQQYEFIGTFIGERFFICSINGTDYF